MGDTRKIIALSGGKDSTALALALQEFEPDSYTYIANPTGNELPPMLDHLKWLEKKLGHLHRVGDGRTFEELIYDQKAIPNDRMRFCTRILKIEPTERFLAQFDDPILYVGLRADEPSRQGMYGVRCRFPLQEWGWGLREVKQFLREKGVRIPKRTDCAWCFNQQIGEWWNLWRTYPDLWKRGEKIERDIGHTFRSPTSDTWPTSLRELRRCFEKGHRPKKALRQSLLDLEAERCRVCTM